MDISNLDGCYLLRNDPVVLPREPGGRSNTGGDRGEHFLSYNHPVMCTQTDLCRQIAHRLTLLEVQEIQEVGQSRVVLEGITVAHHCSSQNLVRACVDISNLDACTFLEIIRLYCTGSREAGATLVATTAVGGRREAMHSLGVVQFTGIAGTKDDRNLRVGAAFVHREYSTILMLDCFFGVQMKLVYLGR